MSLHHFRRTLNWNDHFTPVDESPQPPYDASTHSGFRYGGWSSYRTGGGKYKLKMNEFRVTVTIDKDQSWVVRSKRSAALLTHEQQHYNISALAARDFERAARDLEADSSEELGEKLLELYNEKDRLEEQVQDMYDDDTTCGSNHGVNANIQEQWNIRIRNLMNDPNGTIDSLLTCPAAAP
jgi:hypothetical protein